MNRQQRIWLAAILALASLCLTVLVLSSLKAPRTRVVITTRDVQPFTQLKAEDLTLADVDAATAKLLFPSAYTDTASLVGRVAVRHLRKSEVLTSADPAAVSRANVGKVTGTIPLSAMVPDGQRAMALNGVGISARPGDYVQLFSTKKGAVRPVLNRPLQVISDQGGLVVLVTEAEVPDLLAAEADGGLQAVAAPVEMAVH